MTRTKVEWNPLLLTLLVRGIKCAGLKITAKHLINDWGFQKQGFQSEKEGRVSYVYLIVQLYCTCFLPMQAANDSEFSLYRTW
jgi:hypothetical protein